MNYYVLGHDGASYGPATIEILSQWVAEGRVTPDDNVRIEDLDEVVKAGAIPELFGANYAAPPAPAPPQHAPYYRPFVQALPQDDGTGDVIAAFVIGPVGF